jgi:hypothetical protein
MKVQGQGLPMVMPLALCLRADIFLMLRMNLKISALPIIRVIHNLYY